MNQDRPRRIHEVALKHNRLPVWSENQGNWSFDVELDGDDDEPWVSVESDEIEWVRRERLSRALLGMVYSDTLVGAWSERGVGPLGALAPGVVGGFHESDDADLDRIRALPALDVMTNPYFDTPLRGHRALVIRENADYFEWMAATAEARAEAETIFAIDADD